MDSAAAHRQDARNTARGQNLGVESLETRLNLSSDPWVLASDSLDQSDSQTVSSDQHILSTPAGYSWGPWDDFGENPVEIETGRNADGRIEIFRLTEDGVVWNRWQKSVGGAWANWGELGSRMKSLAVGQNQDGRLEIFAIGVNGDFYHKWQVQPNSRWSSWSRVAGDFDSVEVMTNTDGRIEAFLLDQDGALWQTSQVAPNSRWNAMTFVGGSFQKIETVQNADGRLETFALGKDYRLYQRWQLSPAGSWGGWSRLDSFYMDFDVAENKDGRLELFAVQTNGTLRQRWQVRPNAHWSSWRVLGDGVREIEVVENNDGRLQVFATSKAGRLISRWQVQANGSWSSNWDDLGPGVSQLRTAQYADGRLEIFVSDGSGRLRHSAQQPSQLKLDQPNAWNLNALGVQKAWDRGATGRGVVVAVLDTGVDYNHPDLQDAIWTNSDEIPNNGIDDDGNGFIDDTLGWDFVHQDNNPIDVNGHGTHVAGIIGAQSNGFGVTGIAPQAEIMVVQVLAENGKGSSFDIARGIRYAVDNGAHVVNISIGSEFDNESVVDAIAYARSRNVLIVAGAGNDGTNLPLYPAAYSRQFDNVISVGAHDINNVESASTNNVGSSSAVQVDAPGVNILSTTLDKGYRTMSGTSMAAPNVSGLAALAISAQPEISAGQLRKVILETANVRIADSDARGGVQVDDAVDLAFSGDFDFV